MLKDSSVIAQVSMIIYDVRKQAGLTQHQLADLVGATRSVIARLEDADYDWAFFVDAGADCVGFGSEVGN